MSLRLPDSDEDTSQEEVDRWWDGLKLLRPPLKKRRMVISDDEEDEDDEAGQKGEEESPALRIENVELEDNDSDVFLPPAVKSGGKKSSDKGEHSDSDESLATTVFMGEDEARSVVGSAVKAGGGRRRSATRSIAELGDDDDDDDDLLSIGSNDDEDDKGGDADSDETDFEDPDPRPVSKARVKPQLESAASDSKEPRPGTSSSFYLDKDFPTASELVDVASDNDSDTTFDPTEDFSDALDTDNGEDEDDDFMPPKKKLNQSKKKAQVPQPTGETDSDDDDPIPLPRKDRPMTKAEKDFWVDVDNGYTDQDTPPQYNPEEMKNKDWHGDVNRTVTMLSDTIKSMPMPGDEDADDIKLPPGLVELYPHQKYALRWMSWREGQFPGGGILADEMGLGKTIEVIALLMKSKTDAANAGIEKMVTMKEARKLYPSSTTLVVAPLGCIPQWVREIESKGKNLTVYTYHGTKKISSAVELAKYDVVITTYQTIGKEIPKPDPDGKPVRCFSPLKRIYWLRIVLDEGHMIRNPKTNCAVAISQLEARHRWAVSGTPIHNRPEDFFSMCKFLRLTPFDERSVWDVWIGLKQVKRGAEQRLHVLGKALILRRTKEEVGIAGDGDMKAIPPKVVEIVTVGLTEAERQVYDMLMEYARNVLREFLSQKEQREQGLREGGLIFAGQKVQERREDVPADIRFSHIFALLIRLRQMAVLPHLIHTMLNEEEIGEEKFDEKKPEHIVSMKNPIFDKDFVSSKFQKILEDVDELREKASSIGKPMDKIIIVSSWTSTLDILHTHLMAKNYNCVFITGREDMTLRMDNMDRLNNNKWRPQILLLSLMAGGVGLNLVGANHVFFVEPHWNPQHELQAQDRVHRFGQNKDVFIRRYIAEDTIESRIMDLQQYKLELADGLLKNTKKTRGAGITLEQMKTLFDIHARPPPPPPPSASTSKSSDPKSKSKKKSSVNSRFRMYNYNNSESEHSDDDAYPFPGSRRYGFGRRGYY